MFKVYVVGDAIKVVRRFSLPDVCKRELSKYAGVFQFPRVSGAAASADEADLDPGVAGKTSKHFFSCCCCRHNTGNLVYNMETRPKREIQFELHRKYKQQNPQTC